MKIWSMVRDGIEWLPIIAFPFAVLILTKNLSQPLSVEVWLALGMALFLNLGWIGFNRFVRRQAEFTKRYPGFRWKKTNG